MTAAGTSRRGEHQRPDQVAGAGRRSRRGWSTTPSGPPNVSPIGGQPHDHGRVRGHRLATDQERSQSLFAAGHAHRARVEHLLRAAAAAIAETSWTRVDTNTDIALDVVVHSPTPRPPADATNFLGGIGDVLQGRTVSPSLNLSHLADLATVALFDDDGQIQHIIYRVKTGSGRRTPSG
jgi:hypothetical protein